MRRYTMLRLLLDILFLFFFQAEDGIRDLTVTGVQTCALPIYEKIEGDSGTRLSKFHAKLARSMNTDWVKTIDTYNFLAIIDVAVDIEKELNKIGRASCRERV